MKLKGLIDRMILLNKQTTTQMQRSPSKLSPEKEAMIQPIITEEALPEFQNELLTMLSRASSEMVKERFIRKYNSQQGIRHQKDMAAMISEKTHTKLTHTRHHMNHLHNKQREIRKMNMRGPPHQSNPQLMAYNSLQIHSHAKKIVYSTANERARPKTGISHHRRESSQVRPQTSRPSTQNRPITAVRKQTLQRNSSCSLVGEGQPRIKPKADPLVVYPFENHIRSKRIDQNPRLLEKIIRKKYEQDPQDVYRFVNRIMVRRKQ